MNKKLLISIIVIIAIVAGIIAAKYLVKKEGQPVSPEKPTTEASVKEDSTVSINQMLEETETEDLDKEFQDLDAEFQNL